MPSANRIPPARFGFDRGDPPDFLDVDPRRSAHVALMQWYLEHTNLRIVGGYLGNAAWEEVLPARRSGGWGVAIFANTPSGSEWGTYRATFTDAAGSHAFTWESPPAYGALDGGLPAVQTDARDTARRMRDRMKRLWPHVHRPVLLLDNEDSNGTTLQPAPLDADQEDRLVTWVIRHYNVQPTPGETAAAMRARVKSQISGATRQAHGADAAIPWLRAALAELQTPDGDGFSVRPGLYGHSKLLTDLVSEFPQLPLYDPNYGSELKRSSLPQGSSRRVGNEAFFVPFADPGVPGHNSNYLPKPFPDDEVKASARGNTFTVWASMVQWVGDNAVTLPPASAQQPEVGTNRTTFDWFSSLVDDPLTAAAGPRFALDADAFLWQVTRVAPPAGRVQIGFGSFSQIASLTCSPLPPAGAPPLVSPLGATLLDPGIQPFPVTVSGRRLAILASWDPFITGLGLVLVERTPSGLSAPRDLVLPDPGVAQGAPLAVAADGTDVRAATIGRDGEIRVAAAGAAQGVPAQRWLRTGLRSHPVSRIGLKVLGHGSGVLAVVGADATPALVRWGGPERRPWPPQAFDAGLPRTPALPGSPAALASHANRVVLFLIKADLTLCYLWEYAPGSWSPPAPVLGVPEALSPHSAVATIELADRIDVVALREDLRLRVYSVVPGVGPIGLPATWLQPTPSTEHRFARSPNPFGDLSAVQVGAERVIALYDLSDPARRQPAPPAAGRPPERFGAVSFIRRDPSLPAPADRDWNDLP